MSITTWRELISENMQEHNDGFENVVGMTLTEDQMSRSGCWIEFTIWTKTRVYFPATYDGTDWCESVPRNPSDEKTEPVGG